MVAAETAYALSYFVQWVVFGLFLGVLAVAARESWRRM